MKQHWGKELRLKEWILYLYLISYINPSQKYKLFAE